MRRLLVAVLLLSLTAAHATAMTLTSPALAEGAKISLEQVYTRCGGANVAPALSWRDAPPATKSFALTLIDEDVKPNLWSHWIVIDLPAATSSLAKGATLPSGARTLTSDFGDAAYDGPCPPAGSGVHHYRFTVWAMPERHLMPALGSAAVLALWLQQHALASASLTGHFER